MITSDSKNKTNYPRVRLGDVCTSLLSGIKVGELTSNTGMYPIYGASGFIKDVDFYVQENEYIGLVKDGAGAGRVYKLPAHSSVIGTMMYLIPDLSVSCGYLYYLLSQMRLSELHTGATIPHVYFKDFKDRQIPLPPLPVQQAIAAELDKICLLKRNAEERLRKLDLLVKAKFTEMFGDKDFSEVKAGYFLTNLRNGVSPSSSGKILVNVLTLSAITQGDFDTSAFKSGSFDEIPPADKRVSKDLFYICRGNGNRSLVGSGAYSSEDRLDLVFPDTMIVATVDKMRIALPYLFYVWKMPYVRNQIEHNARTTNGTYKINQSIISEIRVPLPPLSLQRTFAAYVEKVEGLKAVARKERDAVELLYRAKMQEHFG